MLRRWVVIAPPDSERSRRGATLLLERASSPAQATAVGHQAAGCGRVMNGTPSLVDLETVEAEAWVALQLSLPASIQQTLGIHVRRRDDALVFIASGTREMAINKTMGLGLHVPLSEHTLDAVIADYTAAGADRFIIQWHPDAQPAASPSWLAARGFVLLSRIAKHCRPISQSELLPALPPALQIDEIAVTEAQTFEAVVARALGVPIGLEAGIRSTLGQPGWRYYLARDHGRPIAGGAYCVRGAHAWFGFGATLETDRRRGAQTSLLVRRMRDAAADGCVWASAETLLSTAERPNQSYGNLRRLGFVCAYERPNYLLELRPSASTSRPS